MKKDKSENTANETVETTEEPKKKPFFFPSADRTIFAHSMSEARRLLEGELAASKPEKTE